MAVRLTLPVPAVASVAQRSLSRQSVAAHRQRWVRSASAGSCSSLSGLTSKPSSHRTIHGGPATGPFPLLSDPDVSSRDVPSDERRSRRYGIEGAETVTLRVHLSC